MSGVSPGRVVVVGGHWDSRLIAMLVLEASHMGATDVVVLDSVVPAHQSGKTAGRTAIMDLAEVEPVLASRERGDNRYYTERARQAGKRHDQLARLTLRRSR